MTDDAGKGLRFPLQNLLGERWWKLPGVGGKGRRRLVLEMLETKSMEVVGVGLGLKLALRAGEESGVELEGPGARGAAASPAPGRWEPAASVTPLLSGAAFPRNT